MKVLFVSDTYFPHYNGVYNFVRNLAGRLMENGHSVAVLAPSQTTRFTTTSVDGIEVFGVSSFPALLYPVRVPVPFILHSQIEEVLSRFGPDVIHLQSHFFLAKATLFVNRSFGYPIIGTNHFMPENLIALLPASPAWRSRIESVMYNSLTRVFNELDFVTAPTETAAGLIRSRLKVDVEVISNGVDRTRFSTRVHTTSFFGRYKIEKIPVFLFVGRIDPEKKLNEVLRAVQIALQKADFYFVVAGKGVSKENLIGMAVDMDIRHRVIFTGFVPDEDLPWLYQSSDCFVMASTAELQSIATMEAMAAGLPVIAADAGALHELVHNDQNGYLFAPGDIECLADCILRACQKPDAMKEMGKESLRIISNHDLGKSLNLFQSLYKNAVAYRRKSPVIALPDFAR